MIENFKKPVAWVGLEYRELTNDEMAMIDRREKTLKTNGASEYVFIDHPDREGYNQSGYIIPKFRRRHPTNYTPPKKKRKKR